MQLKKNIKTRIKLKDNKIIELVDDFKYLGNTVSLDGRCKKEKVQKICQAKVSFNNKKKFYIEEY